MQERTAELTASVERLTALSAVSSAVSATLDLDRVLSTVVERAAALAGAEAGTIYVDEPEAAVFEPRANHRLPGALAEVLRAPRIRVGESPVGQAAASPLDSGRSGAEDAGAGNVECIAAVTHGT